MSYCFASYSIGRGRMEQKKFSRMVDLFKRSIVSNDFRKFNKKYGTDIHVYYIDVWTNEFEDRFTVEYQGLTIRKALRENNEYRKLAERFGIEVACICEDISERKNTDHFFISNDTQNLYKKVYIGFGAQMPEMGFHSEEEALSYLRGNADSEISAQADTLEEFYEKCGSSDRKFWYCTAKYCELGEMPADVHKYTQI